MYIFDQRKQKAGRSSRERCEGKEKLPLALLLKHAPKLPPTPSSHLPLPPFNLYIMHFPSFLSVSTLNLHRELLIIFHGQCTTKRRHLHNHVWRPLFLFSLLFSIPIHTSFQVTSILFCHSTSASLHCRC